MRDEIKTVRGGKPIQFDKPIEKPEIKKLTQPAPTSKIPAHLPPTNINQVPQKKSVFLIWLLSIITFGIYPALWYIKKVPEFYNLGTQKKLSKALALTLLVLAIFFIAIIIIIPLTITTEIGEFYQNLSTLQISLFLVLGITVLLRLFFSLLTAFYSRTIINQALEQKGATKKISALFTLIFTFLYLQYEINRIADDKEEESRKAPWVFFILIIVLISGWVVFSYI